VCTVEDERLFSAVHAPYRQRKSNQIPLEEA
jgi:hypothetical protein